MATRQSWHAAHRVSVGATGESSNDISDIRMNTVAADYEEEITKLDLAVEEFGVPFDPWSMFRVTSRQISSPHRSLKPSGILDDLPNDAALCLGIL